MAFAPAWFFFSLLDSGGNAVGLDRAVDYLWMGDPGRERMGKEEKVQLHLIVRVLYV